MNFPKLTGYIYNSIRLAAGKLFVSAVGSPEEIIYVNLIKPAKDGEWRQAVLSSQRYQHADVEFEIDEPNYLTLQYTVADTDNAAYIKKRKNKSIENLITFEEYDKTYLL
jgi:hypothetical protein